jgi:serine/threonine protein kinase/tetratricopeptide (TPR) repeat protein
MSEQTIFTAALERDPVSRGAYLEQACGDDQELRQRVEKLLSLHDKAGDFLQEPAAAVVGMDVAGAVLERPGSMIDEYRLLEQIGEGGFGIVFMAEQERPLRRKVALKVLKPGMDTRQVVARFEAERQALALMDHPHIAKVLDAGATESGRPYFVMELVPGIPITDYCDQAEAELRERLHLFLAVCRAVQHAHQKGIIHRDLKPSNILVTLHDGTPVVKVIDFGIAKAVGQQLTDKTLFTNFARMMGTPMYMSPEQAALGGLDIDTRSDIYSLGVLLYELLTGTTPFEKTRLQTADFDEMRRIIRDEDPPPPSQRLSTLGMSGRTTTEGRPNAERHVLPPRLVQSIRGELDWVVMKCLSKDRKERYESASSLAADVERYLAGQPIEARPQSAAYRFWTFARRNRVAITTIGLVAAAMLIGTAVSAWQAFRASDAQMRTGKALIAQTQARQDAESARQRAEANFQKARQAVDRYFTLVSQSELLDEPALAPLRKDLLEAALGYYQEFLKERAGDSQLKVELAAAHFRAGQVCHLIDRNDEAIAHLQQCVRLVEELLGDPRNSAALARQLAGLHQAGRNLHGGTRPPSNPEQAHKTLTHAAEIWERLACEHPHAVGFQSDLAGLCVLTGDLARAFGRRSEARKNYERAAQILEKLVADHPRVANYRADLASCHEVLGLLARLQGRIGESDEALKRSLALREQLVAEFSTRPGLRVELAAAYRELASKVYADQLPLAQANLNRALDVLKRLVADYPGIPAYEEQLARVHMNVADLHWQLGQNKRAEEASRAALTALEQLAVRYPNSPLYRERLVECYRGAVPRLITAGRTDEARQACQRIIADQTSLAAEFGEVPRHHEQLAAFLVNCPFPELRDEAQAVKSAQRAVELQPQSGDDWKTLGAALYRAGKWNEAIEALTRSLELAPGPKGVNQLYLAMAHWQLAAQSPVEPVPAGPALTSEMQDWHRQQAQKFYEAAAEWMKANPRGGEGARRLQAEAAELLGKQSVGDSASDRPPNSP